MEETVDLKSAMERIAVSCAEVRTYRNHFNEGQWQDDLDRLLSLVEEVQGQHSLAIEDSLVRDYANLSGCARQIFIPLTSPSDTEGRFLKLRGAMGNLKSDIDLVLDFASELYPDSGFSSKNATSNIVDKNVYSKELEGIQKQLDEIKIFVNKDLKNNIRDLDLPSEMKLKSENIYMDLRKNINKISISISIGDGIDLAVVERATIAFAKLVKSSIEYFSSIANKIGEKLKASLFELKLKTQLLIRETMIFKKIAVNSDNIENDDSFIEREESVSSIEIGSDDVDQAKVFGDLLKKARIECRSINYFDHSSSVDSLSTYDISRATRIPLHYIESIERGDLYHLPSDVYVIGYVKSIAS